MMTCEQELWIFCFVTPQSNLDSSFFGFSNFISALALLIIVYTVIDIRYRFRVAVAPFPLFRLTYQVIAFVGFGTLLIDIWIAEQWPVLEPAFSQSIWRGIFGASFLTLVLAWIHYAFIKPPIFGVKNYRIFAQILYENILKGSEDKLPVIADELGRSAESIVKISKQKPPRLLSDEKEEEQKEYKSNASDFAHDILLLIGNRKFCRQIVSSSPATAINFFEAIRKHEKYRLPIGQFAENISTEAILNKDSLLYHEDEGYRSGLIGYLKPFSQSIYGNLRLIEELGGSVHSPLDISYNVASSLDASQLQVYCRVFLITLEKYFKQGDLSQHSSTLYRALSTIEDSCRDVYKLDNVTDYFDTDIYKRLRVVVAFAGDAIDLINKQADLYRAPLRVKDEHWHGDFYDHIAKLMFELISSASSVTAPFHTHWGIQHNTIWTGCFNIFKHNKAWKIIEFKLRRLLYDEILGLTDLPNFKSANILGFCLNVMGLKLRNKKVHGSESHALHKVVISWTRKNYLKLRSIQPEVAQSCLLGSISFEEDDKGSRLVKTYIKGLNREAPKEYLELS